MCDVHRLASAAATCEKRQDDITVATTAANTNPKSHINQPNSLSPSRQTHSTRIIAEP